MTRSDVVFWLALVICVLALVAASAGLLWQDGGSPYEFQTLRGQTAQIHGQGLYRYDTVFFAAGNRGVDAVVLFLCVPLLLVTALLYRRGSLRGGLLLIGVLGYFLYVYASMALGAAYNALFLVYIALFSTSLFALVWAMSTVNLNALSTGSATRLPRRGPAIFMLTSGAVTLLVWGGPLMASMMQGLPPDRLDMYTTMVTYVLDLGIITPSTFLSGLLIWRRSMVGYLLAIPLLVIAVFLVPQIALGTMFQVRAGIAFPPGQIAGPISGFALLGLAAGWILIALFRALSGPELAN